MSAPVDGPRRRIWSALMLCLCFGVLIWPAILSNGGGTSEYWDQRNYHEPVIRTFAEQWPRVDLVNYRSATSPGYHLALAIVSRYVSDEKVLLQLASSLFSLGLVLTVWWHAARFAGGWVALAFTAPLLMSSYLLSGAIWLTTDNAAWLFVALALGSAMHAALPSGRCLALGVYATIAVFIRQIHVWLVGPIAIVALLDRPKSAREWIAVAMVVLAPVALVATLVLLWGGLMPPAYVEIHNRGLNPALVPLALALVGSYGVFFLPAFGLNESLKLLTRPSIWLAVLGTFAIATSVPSSYSEGAGRWGGAMWRVVEQMPVIADRSMIIPPLAALGAFVLCAIWNAAANADQRRAAIVLFVGLACWAAAQSMNSQAWQRYCDPIILMTLAWLASMAKPQRNAWIGPSILALLQLGLSIISVYRPMAQWATSP